MAGAPSKFTQDLFDSICNEIAYSDKGLVSICKTKGINACTFYDWIANEAELANKYARAREIQADYLADQIIEISDDGTNDTYKTEEGSESINHDVIARSRLRVDARKWKASKLYPKKYGEKLDLNAVITEAPDVIIPGKKKD